MRGRISSAVWLGSRAKGSKGRARNFDLFNLAINPGGSNSIFSRSSSARASTGVKRSMVGSAQLFFDSTITRGWALEESQLVAGVGGVAGKGWATTP